MSSSMIKENDDNAATELNVVDVTFIIPLLFFVL